MDRRYRHLDSEERGVILAEHRRGASLRVIGVLLGRGASTIGRELRRGRPDALPAQPYCAQRGGAEYRARRKRCGRRTTLSGGSIASESLRIIHRPDEIEGRLVPGHWPYGDACIACRLTGG